MGKVLDTVAPIAGAVIGNILLPGVGGAIGAGLATGVTQGSVKAGLLGGLGSFAGNAIGSTLGGSLGTFGNPGSALGGVAGNSVGPAFGSIGGAASTGLGGILGSGAANSIGASLANTSIGGALGSLAGNSIGSSYGGAPEMPSGPAPFQPTRAGEQDAPESLSALGSLDPSQQSTSLATQGVYGGGNGPQESNYFLNLINRRLIDDGGQVDSGFDEINPIENSYLAKLGLGGQSNPRSLLEAISQWSPA